MKYVLIVLSVLVLLLLVGWTGLQVMPRGFEPELYKLPVPADSMKATSEINAVSRFYDSVFDGNAVETKTSMIAGRARFNIKGISMKGRFISYYRYAEGFYRYIEITWFGIPLIKGYDLYTEDRAEFCMAGKVETGERIEQGQNLALWAESVWNPSILVFNDKVEWHEINDREAVLQIPYRDEDEAISVTFKEDGLIQKMEAMRYKGNSAEKSLWEIECIEWAEFDGMTIPVGSAIKWGDEAKPWAYWNIENVEYNINISEGFTDEMDTYGQVRGE